jgi:hypothetical protein
MTARKACDTCKAAASDVTRTECEYFGELPLRIREYQSKKYTIQFQALIPRGMRQSE